ncbi:hypothetical protein RRG08_049876 [Elysia crispata]|uniref:Uncharacterized protein n=1 Tax=Elysia crispata TaxID=231223 RepID=A0AAE0XZ98_9GAST|nr:hypothetical protein RRG08_049876 [Elysia crispata]
MIPDRYLPTLDGRLAAAMTASPVAPRPEIWIKTFTRRTPFTGDTPLNVKGSPTPSVTFKFACHRVTSKGYLYESQISTRSSSNSSRLSFDV